MAIDTRKKVGEIAKEVPNATRVFEKFRIDYCCGGNESLESACKVAGVSADRIAGLLEQAAPPLPGEGTGARDWETEPLRKLVSYILETHHEFTRRELSRIEQLLSKVCVAHGEHRRELLRVQDLFQDLSGELLAHMIKEEQVLFPHIARMEEASTRGEAPPMPFFGAVRNPIAMMLREHDAAGDLLREIRTATSDYVLEPNACTSLVGLFQALRAFETDLHQHIHLENNILFPRAVHLEAEARCSPAAG